MVSLIKNQILKHLSKFAKNLSTDKFNFSTFKGEGEFTNLELDEIVLTDLLELPCWLRLTSALCNKVSFRIQWAKLKSTPIVLNLDEVHVEVETCEELRTTSSSQGLSSYAGAAKYSFIHKVIDGVTVNVNSVFVTFRSPAFSASVELSRIVVESKSPEWKKAELPRTRIKDNNKGHVLLFKELEWQNVRIEARSTKDAKLTPLRLITNRATCRIVLKKRIQDSFIMGSRLIMTLDDLLWVLTDYQLKAALHFLDSLVGLIQKATDSTRKRKAARKLEVLPEYQAQMSQLARAFEQSQMSDSKHGAAHKKLAAEHFAKIDVVETSYHFISHKIDLHICDDSADGRSSYPQLHKGGSIQITLRCFQVDFYPYHLAAGDRSHWPMYREASSSHTDWLTRAQHRFTADLMAYARSIKLPSTTEGEVPSMSPTLVADYIRQQLATLMTSCFILRLADFTVYQVTTPSVKKHIPKEFIEGDKRRYQIPDNSPILHAEFTYYYIPDDDPFPMPAPKFCVHLDPIQVHFDVATLLWANAFALDLEQSLLQTAAASSSTDSVVASVMTFDIQITAVNVRIAFEATEEHPGQRDRPKSLHFVVQRTSISNVKHSETGFRNELEASVNAFQLASLFYHSEFPSDPEDLRLQVDAFSELCSRNEKSTSESASAGSFTELRRLLYENVTWVERKVWCIALDPVSATFYGARATGNHGVTFLGNLPVTLWVRLKLLPELDLQILTHIATLVSLQLNHYQYLFLLRLAKRFEDLTNYLSSDSARILKGPSKISVVLGAVIPHLEVTMLMPSQTPGKSSSGGDMESFLPDSSSLQDDNWQSSSSGVNEKAKSDEHIRFAADVDSSGKPMNGIVKPNVPTDLPLQSSIESNIEEITPVYMRHGLSVGPTTFTEETGQVILGLRNVFKKGVGSLMTSLDIGNQSPGEMSSSLSIKSDQSSDSENCVLPQGADVLDMYCATGVVEEAADCMEEEITLTSPSDRDSLTNSLKRHDLVSVCTFKLRKVETQFQIKGTSSLLKAEICGISAGECNSIPWDELQSKFNSRHRGWSESMPITPTGPRQIAIRLRKLEPEEESVANSGPVLDVDVRLTNIRLDLTVVSIAGLVELLEDEFRPEPIPATIHLEDIRLHIIDDRPATHITSLEPPPTDVVIRHLLVKRDASGTIEIPGAASANPELRKALSVDEDALTRRLQAENDDLRRRLAALERLTEENYRLKRYQEETEDLRPSLTHAQNKVASLLDDKKALLDNLTSLRTQLEMARSSKR